MHVDTHRLLLLRVVAEHAVVQLQHLSILAEACTNGSESLKWDEGKSTIRS
jgi:hypothetical protein